MIFPKLLRVTKVRAGDLIFPKGHNRITVTHVEQISAAFVRVIGIRTRDDKRVQMTVPIKRWMIAMRENAVARTPVVEPSQQLPAQPVPGVRDRPVLVREIPPVSVLRRNGDVRDVSRDEAGGPAASGGVSVDVDYTASALAPGDIPTFTRLQAVYSPGADEEAPGAVRTVRTSMDTAGEVRPSALGDGGMVPRMREALCHADGSSVRDDRPLAGSGGASLTAVGLIARLRSLDL